VQTALGDVARLLTRKEYVAQPHVDALVAQEKSDPARAVVNLARILAARGHLGPPAVESVTALAASPGGGASSRALGELLRVLLEAQKLTDAEMDALQTPDGVRRLTYVPELVRAQLREQIKADLLEQMKKENWAAPKAFPDWTKRVSFKGDVRTRYEQVVFKKDNAPRPDLNAINGGSGINWSTRYVGTEYVNDRWLNVDQNRARPRLRARVGLDGKVSTDVLAVVRLASGDGSSPVSTNQTLGGSAGNFGKYQVWLDRAEIRWAVLKGERRSLVLEVGRFANPFFTTDLVWDEDVNLDGLVVETGMGLGGSLRPFLTAGAFPVFNTAFAFGAEQMEKFKSRDKWLLAAQLGGEWRPGERLGVKLGAAYYDFLGVEGRASSPCDTNVKGVSCDTDATRPTFAQVGNTYRTLRTPSPEAQQQESLNPTSTAQFQYFGLVGPFRVLALTGRADLKATERLSLAVEAEYVRNLGFRRGRARDLAVTNTVECAGRDDGCWTGGDTGYLGRLTLTTPTSGKQGDWSASLAYRRLETDAVLDAFTDSDFGLGGTNLKGFVMGATICPVDGLTLGARWYSATEVVGSPYGVDVFQLDVGARY
jgi:hypothetical protein